MKKKYIFMLLVALFFGGAKVNYFTTISFAEEIIYDMYEYRPLIVGSTWTFQMSGSSEQKQSRDEDVLKVLREEDYNGTSVKVLKYNSGWTDYFEESDEGIKRHKHLSPDGKEYGVYYPPAIQYPRYIKIGEVYQRENVLKDFLVKGGSQVGEDKEKFTFQLLGIEDVTVPFGEFKDCLKTLAEWKTYDENGKQNLNKVILTWDAKGIGVIKVIYFERIDGNIINLGEGQLTAFNK